MRLSMLWALGSALLDTLSDGLFLEQVGAPKLPGVYLAIALGMLVVSSIILKSLKVASPYRILTLSMSLGVLLCALASMSVASSPPLWFWYALKIASRMFFAVMIASSWTFFDQYHDLQDAKRVYSLYSAAYFLGTLVAGSMIRVFLNPLGFSGLLLVAAASIGAACWQAREIALKGKAIHDDSVEGVFSGSRDSFSSVMRLILRSPFTITLLLLSLFIQLLITVTEFNYMEAFGAHFKAAGEARLTEFLGQTRASISLCNMLASLFLYSRFVRRIGLQNMVLATPFFFSIVYGGWLLENSMPFAILGLIAVDGILFTVEDNSFNLLSNAVPSKLKSKVRIVNDSFFEPVGMLCSALLLFLIQSDARWLGATLTAIILGLTFAIRANYSKAILVTLKDNALHFHRTFKSWLAALPGREQKEAKKTLLRALEMGPEESQLLSIEGLLELNEVAYLSSILQATETLGTLSKIHAMRLLEASPFCSHPKVLEKISLWIQETASPELKKWAQFYLAKRRLHHSETLRADLKNPDLLLRGAALLTLKQSPKTATASKKLGLMLKSSRIDELSMALDILAEDETLKAVELALPFLYHESVLVKRSAARCVSRGASKQIGSHSSKLIEAIQLARDNTFRLWLLDAFGKIQDPAIVKDLLLASLHFRPNERRKVEQVIVSMGPQQIPLLVSLTKDISLPDRARILAGKILGQLSLSELQSHCIEIVDIEIERAYFYFYFAHTIQKEYPLYDLKMLQSALFAGYQSVIDFIIHLLGAAGSLEDPELLVRALKSKNGKVHSHAIESLEKTCEVRIFRLIAPLIEDLPLEEKMAACLRWKGNAPKLSLQELLSKLERSPALFDTIVAAQLKASLQMPGWREQLQELLPHSNPPFDQFAQRLLHETT